MKISGSTSYSCEWQYEDSNGRVIEDEGTVETIGRSEFKNRISSSSLPDDVTKAEAADTRQRHLEKFLSDWEDESSVTFDSEPDNAVKLTS